MRNLVSVARSPRLSDEVARQLSGAIHAGDFGPGVRLPAERELAERFGVSRVVVREAMAQLKTEGLVESRQGLGAFVAPEPTRSMFRIVHHADDITLCDLRNLFQLRIAVESSGARLAAVHAAPDDLQRMHLAFAALADDIAADRDGIDADERFHAAVAAASRNPYYERFLVFVGGNLKSAISSARRNTAERHPDRIHLVQAEHEAVLQAISRGDAAGAERAMLAHLSGAMERLGLGTFDGAAAGGTA